jgi:hypothetical protein
MKQLLAGLMLAGLLTPGFAQPIILVPEPNPTPEPNPDLPVAVINIQPDPGLTRNVGDWLFWIGEPDVESYRTPRDELPERPQVLVEIDPNADFPQPAAGVILRFSQNIPHADIRFGPGLLDYLHEAQSVREFTLFNLPPGRSVVGFLEISPDPLFYSVATLTVQDPLGGPPAVYATAVSFGHPVPEPSTFGVIAAVGIAALVLHRRRRRQR